jgi:hypothetical protein
MLHAQTKIRIEQIARYRIAGVRDQKIADLLGITPAVLKFITDKPEYKNTEEALLIGHLTEMDMAIAGKVEPLRQQMRSAVPAALRCLLDVVNQRRDLRTALAGAVEILKRDPDRACPQESSENVIENSLPVEVLNASINESEKLRANVLEGERVKPDAEQTVFQAPVQEVQEATSSQSS